MTLGDLVSRMSGKEFMEWIAYDGIEPIENPWLQNSQLQATLVNLWKAKGPPVSVWDFMPCGKPQKESPFPDNGYALFLALAEMGKQQNK